MLGGGDIEEMQGCTFGIVALNAENNNLQQGSKSYFVLLHFSQIYSEQNTENNDQFLQRMKIGEKRYKVVAVFSSAS